MRVIFLDFDGVVNSKHTRKRYPDKHVDIDPHHVQFLNKITYSTGAVIVLTSSWRFSDDAIDCLVNAGASASIIGKIPDLTNGGEDDHYVLTRGAEIKTWLSENKACTQFVILDDLPTEHTSERTGETTFFFEGLEDHHVHCSDREGLLEKHVDLAVNIFNKTEKV